MSINEDFLRAVFRNMPDGEAPVICVAAGDPANANWKGKVWTGENTPSADTNNWVSQATFTVEINPFAGVVASRVNDNFRGLYAVLIDDVEAKVPWKNIRLMPSVIIETSEKSHHLWYFLETPLTVFEKDKAKWFKRALCTRIQDNDTRDIGRYGRMPEGINGKSERCKDGEPWVQRIHKLDLDLRFTVEELIDVYKLGEYVRTRHRTGAQRLSKETLARVNKQTKMDLAMLEVTGLYRKDKGNGKHDITCPWEHFHGDGVGKHTGTVYIEPGEANYNKGTFKCHHGHCADRGGIRGLRHVLHYLIKTDGKGRG